MRARQILVIDLSCLFALTTLILMTTDAYLKQIFSDIILLLEVVPEV